MLTCFPFVSITITALTLGTYHSVSVDGKWGILDKVPVSACNNRMNYDQTVLGIDYVDGSNKALSRHESFNKRIQMVILQMYRTIIGHLALFVLMYDELTDVSKQLDSLRYNIQYLIQTIVYSFLYCLLND